MNKRYWLRSGIGLVIVGFLVLWIWQLIYNWPSGDYVGYMVYVTLGSLLETAQFAIPLFIVGSIVGLIYGKIKNRNQVGTTMN